MIEENLFVNAGPWLRFDSRGLVGWSQGYHATLQQELAAVPVEKESWRSRFPTLVGLAKDEKRHWPAGNTITGNIAVNCDKEIIDDNVKMTGKVSDNRVIELQGWKPRLENGNVIYPDGGPELPEELKNLKVGPRK